MLSNLSNKGKRDSIVDPVFFRRRLTRNSQKGKEMRNRRDYLKNKVLRFIGYIYIFHSMMKVFKGGKVLKVNDKLIALRNFY